jgi:hypothetical protein
VTHGGCSHHASGPTPCTIASPTEDPFCNALAVYDGRCGHCSDCTAQNLQNCTKRASALSAAYLAAFIACQDAADCKADPGQTSCVEQQMVGVTPTAAQLQAKDAYCSACGATQANDCAAFFAVDPGSGNNGPGYNVLLYDDAVAAQALTTCAAYCDPFDYAVCVALLACGPSGGDFCDDGGLCTPH